MTTRLILSVRHSGSIKRPAVVVAVAALITLGCVMGSSISQVCLATDKASRENTTRAELLAGSYLRDVFAKYGVL